MGEKTREDVLEFEFEEIAYPKPDMGNPVPVPPIPCTGDFTIGMS